MKIVGIVREIDKLGRIVIPVEYRAQLGIASGDPVEISAEKDRIIIKRYTPSCVFCKSERSTREFMGRSVCENCLKKLKNNEFDEAAE
ncbi:MAG: AbrB/MazE/SpoVT family DNA-binding domain-containing protein [Oscillospiraceae bacterium]|nr:AbrB/MazE/SpoVT family DNA-binding domain-containing protein [Oscillospiraceae bacterium]